MKILVRDATFSREVHTDFSDLLYGCQATCKQTRALADSMCKCTLFSERQGCGGARLSYYESSEPFSLVLRFEGANHQAGGHCKPNKYNPLHIDFLSLSLSNPSPDCLSHQSYIFLERLVALCSLPFLSLLSVPLKIRAVFLCHLARYHRASCLPRQLEN